MNSKWQPKHGLQFSCAYSTWRLEVKTSLRQYVEHLSPIGILECSTKCLVCSFHNTFPCTWCRVIADLKPTSPCFKHQGSTMDMTRLTQCIHHRSHALTLSIGTLFGLIISSSSSAIRETLDLSPLLYSSVYVWI